MKGEMASKHGSSNQRAHTLTYYEDTAAQPPPSLASAPSICRVCTEYEPTSTPKVHVNSSQQRCRQQPASSNVRLLTLQGRVVMHGSHADTPGAPRPSGAQQTNQPSAGTLDSSRLDPRGGLRSELAAKEHRWELTEFKCLVCDLTEILRLSFHSSTADVCLFPPSSSVISPSVSRRVPLSGPGPAQGFLPVQRQVFLPLLLAQEVSAKRPTRHTNTHAERAGAHTEFRT